MSVWTHCGFSPPSLPLKAHLKKILILVSMNRRNDYGDENLFHCSYGHLTAALRQKVESSKKITSYEAGIDSNFEL